MLTASVVDDLERARVLGWYGFKVVALGLLLWLAWVAGKWGLADYYAAQSYEVVRAWGDDVPTEASWREGFDPLARALALDSTNPTYNHRMGRLYHIHMARNLHEIDKWGDLAKAHLARSIAVRPQWPLTWSSVALLKADMLEFDDEMFTAIGNATQYGQWEPGVQYMIATVGAKGLVLFPEATRLEILRNNARGVMSPVPGASRELMGVLEGYGPTDRVVVSEAIGAIVAERDWDESRTRNFSEFTFRFWSDFSRDTRARLREQVVAHASDPGVLTLAGRFGKLAQICPVLPRSSNFDQYCNNRGLR